MINKHMNYKRIYNELIERARNRQLDGYTEKHRIIPGCMGGKYTKDNVVHLTPEEHYVAHQLLVKIYPKHTGLVNAALMLCASSANHVRSNKRYGWLKRRYQKICKTRVGAKNPSYGRSWYHDPVTGEAGKYLEADVPEGWHKGRAAKVHDRYCKNCSVYVDTVSKSLRKHITCQTCKEEKRKIEGHKSQLHDYEIIKKIYLEHKIQKIGFYTLAQKYGINKWTIYDYISRYKKELRKEFGV